MVSLTTPTHPVDDLVGIDPVSKALGEPIHDPLGVVPGAVEATVHRRLDPFPKRVEQGDHGQCRGRDHHIALRIEQRVVSRLTIPKNNRARRPTTTA